MINTLTLNPAIDKILFVEKFEKNVTTRIQRVFDTLGGKGTHVSVNLDVIGEKNNAFGIAHGATGAKVINMMRDCPNVCVKFIHREQHNTRTNYLLNEKSGDSTLITEKGVELTEQDILDVIDCLDKNTQTADFLVFSGDASNCSDPYIYNRVMNELRHKNYKVFLDTSGASLLKCIENKPFLIKPNIDELSFMCSRKISVEADDVIDAMRSIDKYGIPVVAVSLGGEGSIVKHHDDYFCVKAPRVSAVNTVGCGDCFLAGLLHGFAHEKSIDFILRFASAVAAAAAENELSVGFSMPRAEELMSEVKIERILR